MKKKTEKKVRVDSGKFQSDESMLDFLIQIDVIMEEIRYRHITIQEGAKKFYNKIFSDN